MKNIVFKISFFLISLILVMAVSAGVAFAYFTDYDQLSGSAKLSLNGETEIEEDVTDTEKTVSIVNNGEEGKNASCVVKLLIYGPEEMTVTPDVPSDWTRLETEAGVYAYYYNHILTPGQETSKVVANVNNIPKDADFADFEIIALHESQIFAFDEDGRVIPPDGWVDFPEITE